uniref:alkaline phosphatase n=1 Tax=Macrostomum lignano TaxID=282301 RepID=A0A1I8FMI8_9PLAT
SKSSRASRSTSEAELGSKTLDNNRSTEDLKTATEGKNAILFLGDGMGITSVTAGRILKGQLDGKSGRRGKRWNLRNSGQRGRGPLPCYLCGVKAKFGTMGMNELVTTSNCTSQLKERYVNSFLTEAQQLGKSVGIVTTTRITHATPGMTPTGNEDVEDESVRWMCPTLPQQLIKEKLVKGSRSGSEKPGGAMEKKLQAGTNRSRTSRQLGQKNPCTDLVAFDKAIKVAGQLTNSNDTLTVVTADHSHVFAIGGYGPQGAASVRQGEALADDKLPYTPLYYGDGPSGLRRAGERTSSRRVTRWLKTCQSTPGDTRISPVSQDTDTRSSPTIAHVIKYSLCVGAYAEENFCLN